MNFIRKGFNLYHKWWGKILHFTLTVFDAILTLNSTAEIKEQKQFLIFLKKFLNIQTLSLLFPASDWEIKKKWISICMKISSGRNLDLILP